MQNAVVQSDEVGDELQCTYVNMLFWSSGRYVYIVNRNIKNSF